MNRNWVLAPTSGWQSPGRAGGGLRRLLGAPGPSEGALRCGEKGSASLQTHPHKSGWSHQAGVTAHSKPKGCSRLSPPPLGAQSPHSSLGVSLDHPKATECPTRAPAPAEIPRYPRSPVPAHREGVAQVSRDWALEDLHAGLQHQQEIQPFPHSPLSPVPWMPAQLGSATPGTCSQLEEGKEPCAQLGLCPPALPEGVGTRGEAGCVGWDAASGSSESRGTGVPEDPGCRRAEGLTEMPGTGGSRTPRASGDTGRGWTQSARARDAPGCGVLEMQGDAGLRGDKGPRGLRRSEGYGAPGDVEARGDAQA